MKKSAALIAISALLATFAPAPRPRPAVRNDKPSPETSRELLSRAQAKREMRKAKRRARG